MDKRLEDIAKKHFHVETLETRHSDSLDFHDTSVWAMRLALEEAYLLGVTDAQKIGSVR